MSGRAAVVHWAGRGSRPHAAPGSPPPAAPNRVQPASRRRALAQPPPPPPPPGLAARAIPPSQDWPVPHTHPHTHCPPAPPPGSTHTARKTPRGSPLGGSGHRERTPGQRGWRSAATGGRSSGRQHAARRGARVEPRWARVSSHGGRSPMWGPQPVEQWACLEARTEPRVGTEPRARVHPGKRLTLFIREAQLRKGLEPVAPPAAAVLLDQVQHAAGRKGGCSGARAVGQHACRLAVEAGHAAGRGAGHAVSESAAKRAVERCRPAATRNRRSWSGETAQACKPAGRRRGSTHRSTLSCCPLPATLSSTCGGEVQGQH